MGVEPIGMSSGTPCSYQAQSAPLDSGEWPRVCAGPPSLYATCQVPERQAWGLTGMDKEKDMKRIIAHQYTIVLGVLAVLVCAAGIVWATSPHFINASVSFNSTAGTASCTWKESGLGDNVLITYECSADGKAVYACINGG